MTTLLKVHFCVPVVEDEEKDTRSDSGPIKRPYPHPCYRSGSADTYDVWVAYADNEAQIKEYWPEAFHIDVVKETDHYFFTSRFPETEDSKAWNQTIPRRYMEADGSIVGDDGVVYREAQAKNWSGRYVDMLSPDADKQMTDPTIWAKREKLLDEKAGLVSFESIESKMKANLQTAQPLAPGLPTPVNPWTQFIKK